MRRLPRCLYTFDALVSNSILHLTVSNRTEKMSPALTTDSQDTLSPYRSDGKLFGFVCVVTGADKAIGSAIVTELAGKNFLRTL